MKIIVIQVDGVQLAALGAYGNVWLETPCLDRLAAQAVVFDQHFADVPSEEGVRQALLFGRQTIPPLQAGKTALPGTSLIDCLQSKDVVCVRIPSTSPSAAEAGGKGCVRIPLTSPSPPASGGEGWGEGGEPYDYDKGILSAFQVIHARENTLSWIDLGDVLPPWNVSEDRFARQCEDWEFEEEPQSWPDPSPGWLDPADEWSFARLQRTYAAMVETLDEKIGQWLEWFSQQPWWPETVLIFTAGRGQNLGEHGLIGDFRPWLHEELIHLPLMIRLPHDEQAGRRVFALTQTVDIPATILDCFGIAKPEEWHGSSLLPLCRGGAPVRSFACTGLRIGEATEFALRMPDAGIIVPYKVPPEDPPRNPMLFIKPDDRWEVNDLRQANLDEAENLEQTLRNYIAASGLAGEIASDVSERSPSCQP